MFTPPTASEPPASYPPGPPAYPPPGAAAPYSAPGYPPGPAPAKRGNGCLKAFLITAGVIVVVSIVAVVALVVVANRALQNTIGTARPEDFELSADDMTCTAEAGRMTVEGTLTNTTDHRQDFRISVEFVEGPSGPKLGQAITTTGSLPAGGSKQFRASSVVATPPTQLTCRVVDVSYNGS